MNTDTITELATVADTELLVRLDRDSDGAIAKATIEWFHTMAGKSVRVAYEVKDRPNGWNRYYEAQQDVGGFREDWRPVQSELFCEHLYEEASRLLLEADTPTTRATETWIDWHF